MKRTLALRGIGVRTVLVLLTLVVMTFPVYWVMLTSLRGGEGILATGLSDLFPTNLTLKSYTEVLSDPQVVRYLVNSLIVSLMATGLTLLVCVFGGYALARLSFFGSDLLGRVILFAYVVPPVLIVIPLFRSIVGLGLYDSRFGLVIAQLTFSIPFCLWMLRSYFASLPVELEEAALVDGASRLGAVVRIVMPLAAPGIVAAAMFTFVISWDEYLYAAVLLTSDELRTLPVGLVATLKGPDMDGDAWSQLMAASAVSAAPVLAVFFIFQKWMVSGLTAGSVKA